MADTAAPLRIDFVSDVTCPWCAIGLQGLESAIARVGRPVDLRLQPFELNPGIPTQGEPIADYAARKYGVGADELAARQVLIRQRGAAAGLALAVRTHVYNTFDAHRLLHWAGLEGAARQHALKAALLRAYHGEGRNPSDPEVLAALAAEVGLDEARAREILDSDEFADAVRAQEQHWLQLGINSVPAVVINQRHLISGGQPPEVFEQALREIAAAQ
jgi:predicted DsbA family dithiol-disulfide isomerase